MVALFENPFFVREYRLAWRRRFTPYHWMVASVALSGGMVLFLLVLDAISPRHPGPAAPGSAWWLLFPHLVMCLIAAGKSARRTIGEAAAGKPFEQELLVSLTPAEWVFGKMSYPVVLTAIVWGAPIPLLLVAGVFDVVRRQEVVDCLAVPLLLSIAAIPASFLPQEAPPAEGKPVVVPSDPAERVNRWLGSMVTGWFWIACLIAGLLALVAPYRQFYGRAVAAGLPLAGCCVAGAICGWYAGEMTYLRTPWAEARFQRGAYCVLAALNIILLGLVWGWLPWWPRAVVLCAGPVSVALRRLSIGRAPGKKRVRPRLSLLAIRELEWFERHRPNALTQLDLGRALRARSPAVALLGGVGAIAVVVAPTVWAAYRQTGTLAYARFMVGVIALVSLMSACGVVRGLWDADRKTGLLESLFLTPQTSDELVAGRIAAAAGSHGLNVLGITAAVAGFVGWAVGWRGGLPLWIFLAVPSLICAAWFANGFGETDPTQSFYRPDDVPYFLLLFGVAPAVLFASIAGYQGWLPAFWLWSCRILILLANAALARWLFRFRVAELDRLRSGQE